MTGEPGGNHGGTACRQAAALEDLSAALRDAFRSYHATCILRDDGTCGYPVPPLAVTSAAETLRAALPDFVVTIVPRPGGWAFEVTRIRGQGNPVCLISRNPGEIYRALAGTRHP